MAILTRLARLWRADIHALLDRLESPDLVLDQSLREMQQALDEDRQALAALDREREGLAALDAGHAETWARTQGAVADALAAARDDLARPLVRRALECERRRATLGRQLEAQGALRDGLAARIAQRSARLEALRARAALRPDRPLTRDEQDRDWPEWADTEVRDEDVEIALLQAKRGLGGAT